MVNYSNYYKPSMTVQTLLLSVQYYNIDMLYSLFSQRKPIVVVNFFCNMFNLILLHVADST